MNSMSSGKTPITIRLFIRSANGKIKHRSVCIENTVCAAALYKMQIFSTQTLSNGALYCLYHRVFLVLCRLHTFIGYEL